MVKEIHVEGIQAFKKAVEENKGKTIFAHFSGSPGEDGQNWCPDCVKGKWAGQVKVVSYDLLSRSFIDFAHIHNIRIQ